jgi:L-asparaginase type II
MLRPKIHDYVVLIFGTIFISACTTVAQAPPVKAEATQPKPEPTQAQPAVAQPQPAVAQAQPAAAPPAKLPNVVILATGGTIAGTGAGTTTTVGYAAATVAVETLIAAVPELKKVANVKGEQVFQIASENMNNDYWLTLAKRVNTLLAQPDVDGIVITHGTDTLEETAYFLNLVTKSRKPVVLVGAMRPSTALSADGPINLYNATILAGSKEAVGKGVLVAMNDQINPAREVTKTNTSTPDAFKAGELGLLGYMQANRPYFYRVSTRRHTADTEFDISNLNVLPQVDIVYGYANMNPVPLNALVAAGARGIIHAGVGDGSLANAVKPALIAARKKGILIVRSSRVGQGIVARNGEANDDELDFVVSDTLNPQKARILLTLALTKTSDTKEIQRIFYTY